MGGMTLIGVNVAEGDQCAYLEGLVVLPILLPLALHALVVILVRRRVASRSCGPHYSEGDVT